MKTKILFIALLFIMESKAQTKQYPIKLNVGDTTTFQCFSESMDQIGAHLGATHKEYLIDLSSGLEMVEIDTFLSIAPTWTAGDITYTFFFSKPGLFQVYKKSETEQATRFADKDKDKWPYETGEKIDTIWYKISAVIKVVEPSDSTFKSPCGSFMVPDIFDPDSRISNSNGNNYEFRPFGLNTDYYRLMVYTKTGNRVYDSDVQQQDVYTLKAWDGSFLGKPCNSGIYTWHIQYYVNKQLHNCSGDVSLKRNNEDTNP